MPRPCGSHARPDVARGPSRGTRGPVVNFISHAVSDGTKGIEDPSSQWHCPVAVLLSGGIR